MFAIYRKNVGGRITDRYFHKYENAKAAIGQDIEHLKKWMKEQSDYDLPIEHIDEFNAEKGIYLYEYRYRNFQGEEVVYAIVDGFYEDEPNE